MGELDLVRQGAAADFVRAGSKNGNKHRALVRVFALSL